MHGLDFALGLGLMAQPAVLGLLLYVSLRFHALAHSLFLTGTGARRRLAGVRFFECAALPRLVGRVRYTLPSLALCVLFVLYDVDLIFFLAETTAFEQWSASQAMLALLYATLFWAALWYDSTRCGFA